ncbi:MAG: primosomal protein N' [Anaerolineales bacterium]|nr:primosomal protein N' [Anaerolineales bacterium]
MPTYLEVAVNVPQVSGVFHYHLPPDLEGQVRQGHLVVVPFGARTVQGVVLGFVEQPEVPQTKAVSGLVDPAAVLTPQQIELAQQLSHDYLAPLAACIGLMLPPGLDQQADVLYTLRGLASGELTPTQKRLIALLEKRGPLRGSQIDHGFHRLEWRGAARTLVQRGVLESKPVLPAPRVRPKLVRTVRLACSPDMVETISPELGKPGSAAAQRRQAILQFLAREAKPVEAAWVYAESGGNLQDLRLLSGRGLVQLGEEEIWRDPLGQTIFQPAVPPTLTRDQQAAWDKIQQEIQRVALGQPSPPILLHGVTGSGKTELYLKAVQAMLDLGRQAIVLVPEISLTPQTVNRFGGRFPGQVGLIHSGLSAGERYDTWRRARLGEFNLVIGPRSALFTPLPRIGLIVVDECHDDSYYQSEAVPYYHAREAAVAYARLIGAVCLLGSATPDLLSAYRAQQNQWQYIQLPARILAHREAVQSQMLRLQSEGKSPPRSRFRPLEGQAETSDLPPVLIVDMRQELKDGNRSIFSRGLQSALQETLEHEQQAILFLNRRGSATYVFCRDCGYIMKCPHCELPLTFHESQMTLLCHYCGYQRKMPVQCPSCKGPRIRQYGTGTQRVESEIQALFPQAKILRWDSETTRKKGAHEIILGHFSAHRADILIGTQMLAKGLDLPLVTLVGVVLADVGLSLPDYRTNERAFQILTQVAGRAGRSPLGGQVILQTFQPDHYVIQAAAGHNYRAFLERELAYRQEMTYPPFAQLVRLEYRHMDAERAKNTSQAMAIKLQQWIQEEGFRATRLIGPAPCFFARLGGAYRWQIVLVGPDPAELLRGRSFTDWKIEVNPTSLL